MATTIIRPTAAGDLTEFDSVSGAATHWEAVKEVVADDDATYIAATGATIVADLYTMANPVITSGHAITRVRVYWRAKSPTAGYQGQAAAAIKIGGAAYYSSAELAPDGSYGDFYHDWTTNPFTGVRWTKADLNSLQAGVRSTGANAVRVTQVYVEIEHTELIVRHYRMRPDTLGLAVDGDWWGEEDAVAYRLPEHLNERIRFAVSKVEGGAVDVTLQFQWKITGGAFADINASPITEVYVELSYGRFAHGDAISAALLTEPVGSTWDDGVGCEERVPAATTQALISFGSGARHTEIELCFAMGAAATDLTNYQIQVALVDGASIEGITHTHTPTFQARPGPAREYWTAIGTQKS